MVNIPYLSKKYHKEFAFVYFKLVNFHCLLYFHRKNAYSALIIYNFFHRLSSISPPLYSKPIFPLFILHIIIWEAMINQWQTEETTEQGCVSTKSKPDYPQGCHRNWRTQKRTLTLSPPARAQNIVLNVTSSAVGLPVLNPGPLLLALFQRTSDLPVF